MRFIDSLPRKRLNKGRSIAAYEYTFKIAKHTHVHVCTVHTVNTDECIVHVMFFCNSHNDVKYLFLLLLAIHGLNARWCHMHYKIISCQPDRFCANVLRSCTLAPHQFWVSSSHALSCSLPIVNLHVPSSLITVLMWIVKLHSVGLHYISEKKWSTLSSPTSSQKFLTRDATQSTVMPQYVVCLSETFRYRDHIGWNTSKIISPPNSLRPLLGLTPTWAIWCNEREHPQS